MTNGGFFGGRNVSLMTCDEIKCSKLSMPMNFRARNWNDPSNIVEPVARDRQMLRK